MIGDPPAIRTDIRLPEAIRLHRPNTFSPMRIRGIPALIATSRFMDIGAPAITPGRAFTPDPRIIDTGKTQDVCLAQLFSNVIYCRGGL